MPDSHLTLVSPRPEPAPLGAVTEASIRDIVEDLASGLTPPTIHRYRTTVESLFHFLDVVDVGPCLGQEIAEHLRVARRQHGAGAFLPTLGVVSLVRVLPQFVSKPWLPPRGCQRRTHRTVINRLIPYLRRHLPNPALQREDLARVRSRVDKDRFDDYGGWSSEPVGNEAPIIVTSTLAIRPTRLDQLLDSVEQGSHDSLDEAITSVVDPRYDEHEQRYWY